MSLLQFDLPKDQSSIIKVIGVGGGGGNAVNHMYNQGIVGVNFVISNTDAQALETSPIPNKIQLGPLLTQGLGAGSNPDMGMQATEESIEEIKNILGKNTKMVFVTAGMGGGTGTGGAPVVAKIAKEMGILTVAIVTTPFSFEGKRKFNQAIAGIEKLKQCVDTILVISNDKIREIFGNSPQSEAFNQANNILTTAAKSISEIITIPGYINVDFADVKYVMQNSGVAIMGNAVAEGEGRAINAIQGALNSPLLNDNDIRGAQKVLVNITFGSEQITIDEITVINEYLQDIAKETDIIFGTCEDLTLGNKISVTIIATGFEPNSNPSFSVATKRVVHELSEKPLTNVVETNEFLLETTKVVEEINEEDIFVMKELTDDSELNLFSSLTENENTVSFDFEMESTQEDVEEHSNTIINEVAEEKTLEPTEDEFKVVNVKKYEIQNPTFTEKQMEKDLTDRKKILNQLSHRSLNRNNLKDIEDNPAYLRKNIQINNSLPSEEKHMSDFTLGADFDSNKPLFRKNNTFLEDLPD
jgi:cell division protein FtsZ